jgi:hypothetical protein
MMIKNSITRKIITRVWHLTIAAGIVIIAVFTCSQGHKHIGAGVNTTVIIILLNLGMISRSMMSAQAISGRHLQSVAGSNENLSVR